MVYFSFYKMKEAFEEWKHVIYDFWNPKISTLQHTKVMFVYILKGIVK
jgi:hypothetical protein